MTNSWPGKDINNIELSVSATPGKVHADGLTEASARKTSELLTVNHALYHTRWKATFHNHLVHHLLTMWSLGATPDEIQDMWDYNEGYQTSIERPNAVIPEDLNLKDPEQFESCLGKDEHYLTFLKFFKTEIAEKGAIAVIREYVLKEDRRANDILSRMYTDLVHPMIHLGCAIEYQQPSLVAEALAGACVHENWPTTFLAPAEEYARTHPDAESKSLLHILEGLRRDPIIATGVRETDPFNKIPDGFLKRVTPEQLVPHLCQFRVKPDPKDLKSKMTEMMYTCAYMMGAAQRPGKREAVDFVTLHAVTLSVFYPAILAQDWLTNEEKARLIEGKARVDAVMYAGCGSPALYANRITEYQPQSPADGWPELFHRSIVYRDEGHAVKLIRAMYSLEQLDEPSRDFPLQRKDILKLAHLSLDSIERAMGPNGNMVPKEAADAVITRVGHGAEMVVDNMTRWVFYGGLEKAWDTIPDLG